MTTPRTRRAATRSAVVAIAGALASVLGCGLVTPLTGIDPAESANTSDVGTASTSTGATGTTASSSSSADSTSEAGDGSSGTTGEPPPMLPTCPFDRSEADRPDDVDAPQIRVMYVLPADVDDEALDTNDRICDSVRSWTTWLRGQSDDRQLRLDTAAGALDIGFVRLSKTDAQMHGTAAVADVETGFAYVRNRIEQELLLAGLLAPGKIYAVYYGGSSEYACGGGAYPPTIVDQVAAMYLGGQIPGYPACTSEPWGEPDTAPAYVDYAMLHELMHTLGAVDLLAPHEHASGHAYDDDAARPWVDLMYSPREGENDPPWGVYEPDGLQLDLGRDDYFDHGDPELVDLARSVFLEPTADGASLPPGW